MTSGTGPCADVYRPERYAPFLRAIACPVLTVTGGRTWYRWPDPDERQEHREPHLHLEDCGHSPLRAPGELAARVTPFLASCS